MMLKKFYLEYNMSNNLLFATVDLPPIDKTKAVAEIKPLLNTDVVFWDAYREISMIPLVTKTGKLGAESISNRHQGEFVWAEHTPPTIKEYFDNVVFPWLGMRSRLMILITQPGAKNAIHIDSKLHEVGTKKHKFRIVLQGRTDTLFFRTKTGDVHVPEVSGAFLMDGSWVHGMDNETDEVKLTLALGSPWEGHDEYGPEVKILMDRRDYLLPEDLSKYEEKPGTATY
jgi:hypothetical protein